VLVSLSFEQIAENANRLSSLHLVSNEIVII